MRRLTPILFTVFTACSSSESPTSTPPDAGIDAATDADAAPDVELTGFKCGAPPYYKWSGYVEAREPSGNKPAAGAKLTVSACPSETLTLGADGKFELLLPQGVKAFGKLQLAGSLNTLLGEWSPQNDLSNIAWTLPPNLFAALIPDWDPSTEAAIALRMEVVPGATGACAEVSGVSFLVKDQPTAIVSYFDEGSIPTAIEGGKATTSGGLVTFSNMTGDAVEIVGTKPGCTVTTKLRTQSGRISLAPQYLNTIAASVGN